MVGRSGIIIAKNYSMRGKASAKINKARQVDVAPLRKNRMSYPCGFFYWYEMDLRSRRALRRMPLKGYAVKLC